MASLQPSDASKEPQGFPGCRSRGRERRLSPSMQIFLCWSRTCLSSLS